MVRCNRNAQKSDPPEVLNLRSPNPYSEKIASQVLALIEDGETIASIARMEGMPPAHTIRKWQKGDVNGVPADFSTRFEKAAKIRLWGFVDDLIQLPRDIDPNHPGELQRARLECENRRWLLSKLLRTQFGDQSKVELGGETGEALVDQMQREKREAQERSRRMVGKLSEEDRQTIQKIAHKSLQLGI